MDKINYKGQELFSPKMDLVFKVLFGSEDSKEILRSFLNNLLGLQIENEDAISFSNTELPAEHPSEKMNRLDIRVKTQRSDGSHEHIDIEIQLADMGDMVKRSAYYVAKLFVFSLKEGEKYEHLGRAIALNLLDFTIFDDEKWMHRARFKEIDDNTEMTDCMELNFVEMPKLKQNPRDDFDLGKAWIAFLNANSEEDLDMLAQKDTNLQKAVERLQKISSDEKLQYEYDMREKALRDHISSLAYAKSEGREEGISVGEKKGKLETAKAMKLGGLDIPSIIKFTGLSEEEVNNC